MHHGWLAWLFGDLVAYGAALGGAFLGGATGALKEKFREWTGHDTVEDYLKELMDDFLPDASTYEEARERLDELLKNANEFRKEVVEELGEMVGDILDTGAVPAQTDGGLGETHDIYAPESEAVPNMPVGELPGFGSAETGMNRDAGEPSYPGGGSSGGGGGGSSPTPLGQTSPDPAPPADAAPSEPSFEDLGLDPDGGAYYEYHPGEGEVVITHPDGTTEVRPWP